MRLRNDIRSFHGDTKIKEKFLKRVRAHRKADEIIHGTYWQGNGTGKGCAVGCTLHDPSGNHYAYETELGIPGQLAAIQDGLFERMSRPDDVLFPEQFLEAIPVGVDLYPAYWKFMLWVLTDTTDGLLSFVENEDVKTVIGQIAELYQKAIDGNEVTDAEFDKIRGDARDALAAREALDALAARDARDARAARDARDARAARAALAALAARDARDARAARAALDALAAREALDALAARDARDARAARAALALKYHDKLLQCLREA